MCILLFCHLKDLVTDLTAQEGEILLFDDSVTMSAHSGMLHVARNLYRKLLGKFILVVCKSYIFFRFYE